MANLRSRFVAVVVLLAILSGWEPGRSASPTSSNAVHAAPPALPEQPVPAPAAATPATPPKRDTSTIEKSYDGVRFAMDLPGRWSWTDDNAFAHNSQTDLRFLIFIVRSTYLNFDSEEYCDTDSAAVAAQKRLAELPDEKTLNANHRDKRWKTTIRDQRIIQVDGIDAVWQVTSSGRVDRLPWGFDTVCYLRWGGVDFSIEGSYLDNRPERTASDLDQKQAEILQIIQSFRLIESRSGATRGEKLP